MLSLQNFQHITFSCLTYLIIVCLVHSQLWDKFSVLSRGPVSDLVGILGRAFLHNFQHITLSYYIAHIDYF